VQLFDSGCIICEVRDFRRRPSANVSSAAGASTLNADVSHVLLRPTTQSVVCDSNLITAACLPPSASIGAKSKHPQPWAPEERAALENQLAAATAGPLCLDPNPVVSLVARKAEASRRKFNTPTLKRSVERATYPGVAKKRKLDALPAAAATTLTPLRLHDFIATLSKRRKKDPKEALSRHQTRSRALAKAEAAREGGQAGAMANSTTVTFTPAPCAPPSVVVDAVEKLSRPINRRPEINDLTPHLVEEYVLETAERGNNRIYHTRLTIFQRLANEEYLGELYVERDYRENENKGSTCRFVLGTR